MSNPFHELNVDVAVSALLKEEELSKLIKAYFKLRGYNATQIKVKVTTREVGDQRDSYTQAVFEGVEVKLEPMIPPEPRL